MKQITSAGILFLFAIISCKKNRDIDTGTLNQCQESKEEEYQNINIFDINPSSSYYNTGISIFKIKKERINRTGFCPNLASSECKNYLTIQNSTSKKITYSFTLEYRLNLYYWAYQNTVTILPNSTIDLGFINSNCGSLSLGTILVRLGSITYQ